MKKIFIILLAAAPFLATAQDADIINGKNLTDLLTQKSTGIEIINFWATWCAPCVAELPLLEKLNSEGRPDVRVTLVSVDMELDPDPAKVYKFVSRKKLKSKVLLLNEPDIDLWINAVDKEWQGSLPATLVINHKTGKRKFVDKELHDGDLEKLIEEVKK